MNRLAGLPFCGMKFFFKGQKFRYAAGAGTVHPSTLAPRESSLLAIMTTQSPALPKPLLTVTPIGVLGTHPNQLDLTNSTG